MLGSFLSGWKGCHLYRLHSVWRNRTYSVVDASWEGADGVGSGKRQRRVPAGRREFMAGDCGSEGDLSSGKNLTGGTSRWRPYGNDLSSFTDCTGSESFSSGNTARRISRERHGGVATGNRYLSFHITPF